MNLRGSIFWFIRDIFRFNLDSLDRLGNLCFWYFSVKWLVGKWAEAPVPFYVIAPFAFLLAVVLDRFLNKDRLS